ncbi:MAG TPA: thiamine pyrophosphate-binding protein [Acidimicrobiales bacterium]|nr:thiamine pyrophosphate-binding protein [Acidimicrobiales bacterium]
MRVADVVARTLAAHGVRDVFMVTGGAAMHLNDAFASTPGIDVTCFHHEQAAAMAAESYYRTSSRLAAVNVTSGPGATNAITGVLGAWDDSLAMVVVSGQVKREHLASATGLGLRQLGDQEVDIVSMVSGITKYAVCVTHAETVRYHLERAIHLAEHGRPGPVWIDIPVDVQGELVEPDDLVGYDPAEDAATSRGTADVGAAVAAVRELLERAERPVVYAGPAIRTAGALGAFHELVPRLGFPVVTALNAHDLLDHADPHLVGRPGIIGDRSGNLAVQNADLVLVLGTRLKIGQVGYDAAAWAPAAHVVMVDIDPSELAKPTIHVETPVHADVREFLDALVSRTPVRHDGRHATWLAWCKERSRRYPVVLPEYYDQPGPVNVYTVFPTLFERIGPDDIVVAGNSWAGNGAAQCAPVRAGQRLFSNSGCGAMGHDLPAAIGAAIAAPGRRVVCIAGDGSLQLNIQELQTLVHHALPVTIYVLDNGGYDSIRKTQQRFFPDHRVGFDTASGLSLPDMSRIAHAYGIPFRRAEKLAQLVDAVEWAREIPGPAVVEVAVDPAQEYVPKSTARMLDDGRLVSAPLEDMAPFLPRDEVDDNVAPARGALRTAPAHAAPARGAPSR